MFPNVYTNAGASSAGQSGGQSGSVQSEQRLGRQINELSVELVSIIDLDEFKARAGAGRPSVRGVARAVRLLVDRGDVT
jgi:hypothetical protein